MYEKDSIKVNDSLKFRTKNGKIVYGGGGIVPDVFVPLQINQTNQDVEYILQSGIIGHYVFEILDKNRASFSELTNMELNEKLNKDDAYFNEFKKYLSRNKLNLDLSKHKNIFKTYINAEFFNQLVGEELYYKMILKEDKMVEKVLENINQK